MIDDPVSDAAPGANRPLARQLGLASATALVVAEVIGVGIFLTTAGMARSLGSPFWLLAVWLVTGVGAIGGAICFGALAARRPEAGGPYVFLREAYGRPAGFLYGWLSMLVTDPGITAAVAVGLASYVGYLVPLSAWGRRGVAVAAILLLAAVNIRGVRLGSGVIRGLAWLKLGLLGFLVLWGLALGRGDWGNLVPLVAQRPGSQPLAPALIGGMIAAFFSLGGWWDVSKLAGEIRDPGRTLPRALLLGVGLVTLVYVLITLVFLYLVPLERIESREAFAALAGEALFGREGGVVLTLVVLVAVAGSLAALLMAMPRVYFALARDGLFFHSVAALHPRFQTPARAIAIQAVLGSLISVLGTFDEILAYFVVPTVVFVALTVGSVFLLRRREPLATGPGPGPLVIPWHPLPPLLFLVPTAGLMALMAADKPAHTGIGLAVVLLGLPVYAIVSRRLKPQGAHEDLAPAAAPLSPAATGAGAEPT
jgi:APA family basic amino acid/polyamine antiporter